MSNRGRDFEIIMSLIQISAVLVFLIFLGYMIKTEIDDVIEKEKIRYENRDPGEAC